MNAKPNSCVRFVDVVKVPLKSKRTNTKVSQFCVCGDFLIAAENAANWRIFCPRSCLHRDCRSGIRDFGGRVSGPRNSVSWENGDRLARDRFEVWRLGRSQTEQAVLARPFGGSSQSRATPMQCGRRPLDWRRELGRRLTKLCAGPMDLN